MIYRLRNWSLALGFLGLALAGCERPSSLPITSAGIEFLQPALNSVPTPTLAPRFTPPPTTSAASAAPTTTPTRQIEPEAPAATPEVATAATGDLTDVCGQLLPILPATLPSRDSLNPDSDALVALRQRLPAAALPAFLQLLAEPGKVGLAAYRVGEEAGGAYLNQDVPMPLASVVKVVHLVAYAEAVAAGELNPLATISLAEIEAFYQPGLDLGAHERAISELTEKGRTFGLPANVLLDEVPWMMIRHSSNAAADYLHMLLGQARIEETAVSLGLRQQTAPCPFLGQFLAMGNYMRSGDDQNAVRDLIANPEEYSRNVMQLTTAYSSDPDFRAAQQAWRSSTRRPNGQTQRLFTETLNAQGSAADYAQLMARIALNGLGSSESSYLTRRYLEWPMQFNLNQGLFSNLGYKNGSLPGVLTTVYYAYPLGNQTPLVVALFYRALDGATYREWRSSQTHDEFARWLLYDPEAIRLLRAVLQ